MAKAKYELDVSDVISKAQQYAEKITQMKISTEQLSITQARYGKTGNVLSSTVEIQIDKLRTLKVELDRARGSTESFVAAGRLTTPATQVKNAAAGAASEAQIRALFPVPPGSTVAQLARYENAVSRITRLVADGKIAGSRVNEIFSGLNSGQALSNLSAIEQKVSSAISSLSIKGKTAKPGFDTGAAAATDAQLRALYPAPTTATITQISRYEAALSRVSQAVGSGKLSGARVQELLNGLQSKSNLGPLSGDEQKLVATLGQIGKGFRNAEKDAQSFDLTVRNAFRITEAFLLKDALGAVVSKLKEAIGEAIPFQVKISEIRTISQGNQASFDGWANSIRKVSDEFGLGNLDVAEAAYQAISNQVTSGQVETEKFLKSTANFARVGGAKLTDAVELTSSAINAYGFNLSKTDQLQGQFFKAVELGRFRVSDLANSFGRVAAPAAAIGVSFEEVLAGLTTLTRQGVTAADAQTQLLNLFNSLAKPSKALSTLLQQLGVDSAQAGIATFGLTGFLGKLEDATKGDIAAIAELGGDLRAIRAIIGLTTRGQGDQFRSDLKDIQGATESFKNAIDIRGESGGDQLIKEFTKIKNFFVVDLGQSAVNSLANLNANFFSLSGSVVGLSKGITLLIGGYALYKSGTIAISLANALLGASFVKTTAAAYQNAAAMSFASRTAVTAGAALNAIPWVRVITLAALAGVAIKETFFSAQQETESFLETQKRLQNLQAGPPKATEKKAVEIFTEGANQRQTQLDDAIKRGFQDRLKNLAQENIKNNELLSNLKSKGTELADSFKTNFAAVNDAINKSVQGLTDNIQRAKRGIEEIDRSIKGTQQTTEQILFDIKLQFANDRQKVALRDQEIKQLTAEAQKIAQEGGPDAVSRIIALKKEVANLSKENAIARTNLSIDGIKQQRQSDLQAGVITAQDANSPIQVNPEVFRQGINANLTDFDAILLGLQNQQKKEIANNDILLAQEKERLRLGTLKAKELEKATPFNAEGGVRKEFLTPQGKFNAEAFNKSRSGAEEAFLKNLAPPSKADAETQNVFQAAVKQLKETFEQERLLFRAQAEALVNKTTIEAKQTGLTQEREKASKDSGTATQAQVKSREEIQKTTEQIVNGLKEFENTLAIVRSDESFKTRGSATRSELPFLAGYDQLVARAAFATFGGLTNTKRNDVVKQQAGQFTEADQQIALIKGIISDAIDSKGKVKATIQDIDNAKAALATLNLNLDRIAKPFTGKDSANDFGATGSGVSIGTVRNDLTQQLDQLRAAIIADQAAKTTLEGIGRTLNEQNQLGPLQLDALRTVASLISLGNAEIVNAIVNQARANPLNVPGYHTGGLIRGPRGNDNLLIRAEDGEMIMSRNATSRFFPQLVQMNGGVSPSVKGKFHSGGIVNQTTVGDVNVTVSQPMNARENIRDIGNALRREIRQGNLKL